MGANSNDTNDDQMNEDDVDGDYDDDEEYDDDDDDEFEDESDDFNLDESELDNDLKAYFASFLSQVMIFFRFSF